MTSPNLKPCGAQPILSQTRTQRFLRPSEITVDATFQFRQMGNDKAHVRGLSQTLRTVGDLDPVLIWQERDTNDQLTGRLILLDGRHRLAAYATAKGNRHGVPAVVIDGDRTAAMLAAVRANTRDSLPLTKSERMDAAWRLVRLPGKRVSVPTVAKSSGVGAATVDRMRKRWLELQAASKDASGAWWRDRQDELPDMEDHTEMTDAARKAIIEQLAKSIREAVGTTPWKDEDLVAEALLYALGRRKLQTMAEYLFGDSSDEFAGTEDGGLPPVVQYAETDAGGQDF